MPSSITGMLWATVSQYDPPIYFYIPALNTNKVSAVMTGVPNNVCGGSISRVMKLEGSFAPSNLIQCTSFTGCFSGLVHFTENVQQGTAPSRGMLIDSI